MSPSAHPGTLTRVPQRETVRRLRFSFWSQTIMKKASPSLYIFEPLPGATPFSQTRPDSVPAWFNVTPSWERATSVTTTYV